MASTAAEARKAAVEDRIRPVGAEAKRGIHLEFVGEPGFQLDLPGMERRREGIRLVNVRTRKVREQEEQVATVYVPPGALKVFETKLAQYASEVTPKRKDPKHQSWAAPIAAIERATLKAFWTDAAELFPAPDRSVWWEAWLAPSDDHTLEQFRDGVSNLGLVVGARSLRFPERQVVLVYGSTDQLTSVVEAVDSIAELRQAREIAHEYMALPPSEMRAWAEELLQRIELPPRDAPAICILDTGINREHPLIVPFLGEEDLYTVDEAWGREDHEGHGTEMAGIAVYEDLAPALASSSPIVVPSVLESVKILPRAGENPPELWGWVTQQGVARVEIERPERRRCHLMAVTATATRDRGRPSSWSGAVDQLAVGDEGGRQRLIIVSAGNEHDSAAWLGYPDHLGTSEVHDPAQAWNAVAVGAYTERWQIAEGDLAGWEPVAPPGDLAPMTSTSATWQHRWPLKPDIVLEGGNAARDSSGQVDTPDSLRLLTTFFRFTERSFTATGGTSAAGAQAARLAGFLQAYYPEYWPETIRALLIHSARWTQQMLRRFGPIGRRGDARELVRSCGFGVPSLGRALWSAGNRLTLIVQEELRPFTNVKGGEKKSKPQLNEMHFHELPWPRGQLEALGDLDVQLRVTLSYFVEPSPGERGWHSRYRYASHGLRFDVRGAQESESDFRKRLNKEARAEDEGSPGTGDTSGWTLGPYLRHRGSVHSDVWKGPAVDLATRSEIGVYPTGGWWNERHHLESWNRRVRYALVVSIEAPEIEVDLYTPVATHVGIPIEIGT